MTNLKSILKSDIERTIDGVIKADDMANTLQEVEEYVFTKEISKNLDKLITGYRESIDYVKQNKIYPFNGVWISGYFGSGKSHLLKMLAYLLENKQIDGKSLMDIFSKKISDQVLKANLSRVVEIPSKSILFNIDQEADASKSESDSALLYIFEKVFNRQLGYFPYDRKVAEFERHLDDDGTFESFKENYNRINGVIWEDARSKAFLLGRKKLIDVLSQSQGLSEEDARALLDQYKQGSALSIDGFVKRVKEWLDRQEDPNFRLNFMIDEVGQFIAGKTRLMLNLQTLAETFGTVCQGRVWIFVTSQEDLVSVVGDPTKQQVQDFSKINARFHYKISLSSADVQEVIQKRLLDKTDEGRETLGNMYMKEKQTFKTLFRFEHGGQQIVFKDKEQFILSFPFQAYQYDLLQQSLRSLSEHNAFHGQHISQGERSMLVIFQDVSKELMDKELFVWATFDQMFAGIRGTLNTGLLNAINIAEKNIDNPIAIKLLKILLLVKYVRTFKATIEHLRILLIKDLDQNLRDLDSKITEALNLLEYQSYIQRNGLVYEYLTNEEKDVEEEIKGVEISHDELRKFIIEIAFNDILKIISSKIRDLDLNEDYSFEKIIDGERIGKSSDLGIHIITPDHPNYDDRSTLLNQAMGKKELQIILESDPAFQKDLRLYFQTDLYCRQNLGHDENVQIQRIISEKQHINGERKNQLRIRLTELISTASWYVMANKLSISSSDPRTCLAEGFKNLLRQSYPNLKFLGSHHYVEANLKKILYPDDSGVLFSGDSTGLNEAEKEMIGFIQREFAQNQSLSLRRLMDTFQGGQCGWYHWAVICITASLFTRNKIEFKHGNNLKNRDEIYGLLSSNRGYDEVRIQPVEETDKADLDALKEFHRDLFNRELTGTNPKEYAVSFKSAILEIKQEVQKWVRDEAFSLPFISKINPVVEKLTILNEHEWSFYLNKLSTYKEELLTLNREEIEPLRSFMNSSQKDQWIDINTFYNKNSDNMAELGKQDTRTEFESLLSDIPYRNGVLKDLKALVRETKEELEKAVSAHKKDAVSYIRELDGSLMAMESYKSLEPSDRERVRKPVEALITELEDQDQLVKIRNKMAIKGPALIEEAYKEIERIINPEEKVLFATSTEKKVSFKKPVLISEEDVLEYSESLKKKYLELVRENKRISL